MYADKFSNDGEPVRLVDIAGSDIFSFTFNDIWFPPTDGDGHTLVALDESDVAADRSDPATWAMSCQLLGNPGAANGPVFAQHYEGWTNYHFTEAERADPLISGPLVDREGDGIVNLLEFALGLDPNLGDAAGLPTGSFVKVGADDYLSLSFRRLKKPIDLIYRVQVSSDLQNWTEVTTVVGIPIDNGDGTETVTIRDTQTLGSSTSRFMRLEVEGTSP